MMRQIELLGVTGGGFAALFGAAFVFGCSEPADPPGAGGAMSSGGAGAGGANAGAPPTSGNGGVSGRGGSAAGGTAGVVAGAGGSSGGAAGKNGAGGAPGGNGGSAAGKGGSASGAGGSAAGTGGSGAGAGSGGAAGGAGGGSSGSGSGGGKSSSGCGKAAPASERYTIDVDGTEREYILEVPDDYDPNNPYRLVFGWHPLGGSAQQVASGNYYNLVAEADGTAIFVAPEGLPFSGENLGWGNTNGRDLAFLDAMMERFRGELCFDEERVFSTGFSFGGMMSFAVACQTDGVMRAVAPQAGNIQVSGCEDGSRPVAVMGFHGDDDTVVPIDGGRAGRDVLIERNGCSEQTVPVDPSVYCDGLNSSNEPCSCVSYEGCMDGYPVIWCEFNGPHTPAPSSGATIWNFFSQF
jgi:polyhydroxybutyrate depolymerase